jgi:hypothetical protein
MSGPTLPSLRDSVSRERVDAVQCFGFTERQARFLVHVLIHSGVFLERQYRAFARIAHGQKTHDFLAELVGRGYARAITPGPVHRGRLYHVQFKPLYRAIGEADNRHRKPAVLGRFVERLMVLDAVLDDGSCTWLGTERDKRSHFMLAHPSGTARLQEHDLPRLVFGQGDAQTVRYFPRKMPIGVPREGFRYVFLYLMTREAPEDFRLFLHGHRELLSTLYEWSIRILVPQRFHTSAALCRHAVREEFGTPVTARDAEALAHLFRARSGGAKPSADAVDDAATALHRYGRARVRALRRTWDQDGDPALWSAQSPTLRDHLQTGRGRLEFVALNRQYLQLSQLVGVA